MKRKIAIVAGGDSQEHDVSLRSARGIMSFMDKERYDCYIIEITGQRWTVEMEDGTRRAVDRRDFSFLTDNGIVRPDFAYITIHGTPGENGVLQGYFDLVGIPYSTSGVLVEALTFNKYYLNQFLRNFDVNVADSVLLRRGSRQYAHDLCRLKQMALPLFVKPSSDGSSFGVTKVMDADSLMPAVEKALDLCGEAMVESLLVGTEITCGCYKTRDKECVLPITEVVTQNEFFDYDAKYNGAVTEITPARIAPSTAERVSQLTSRLYDLLGCEGIIRIDYILSGEPGNEQINLLEINTTPGMTATSFIPQQVRAAGLQMSQVLTDIIENKF